MLEYIKDLAQNAGSIIREGYLAKTGRITHKGVIDLLTDTDLASEEYLTGNIKGKFPDDMILAEEQNSQFISGERIWIIDPLDGTTNFVHRFPFCAVSIALEINNVTSFAVVYNPVFDEMFWASRGKGSYLNGKRISVSATDCLNNALVATGFPYDRWQHADYYLQEYLAFMKNTQGVRRTGAAALDLCYVACGRLDGFFEHKLKPWDTAAGSLIVQEAGGFISDYDNGNWYWTADTIVASNNRIHAAMIKILASCH
ncbi:MAG: inositol monophosphatase [Candidatus Cloacimonetes bacterium]|nr:inositol monophosphatase [Candidatus Cloacimonadota bacterium]